MWNLSFEDSLKSQSDNGYICQEKTRFLFTIVTEVSNKISITLILLSKWWSESS